MAGNFVESQKAVAGLLSSMGREPLDPVYLKRSIAHCLPRLLTQVMRLTSKYLSEDKVS